MEELVIHFTKVLSWGCGLRRGGPTEKHRAQGNNSHSSTLLGWRSPVEVLDYGMQMICLKK